MDATDTARLNDILERGCRLGPDALSADERTVFLIADLDTCVGMSGLHAYFHTLRGSQALAAAAALERIGAPQAAELVRTACRLFPTKAPPADWEERRGELRRLDDNEMERLSIAYRAYGDAWAERFEEFVAALPPDRPT